MGHLVYRFALYFQTNEIKIKALISWFLLNYLLQKELFYIISSHGSISMKRLEKLHHQEYLLQQVTARGKEC